MGLSGYWVICSAAWPAKISNRLPAERANRVVGLEESWASQEKPSVHCVQAERHELMASI